MILPVLWNSLDVLDIFWQQTQWYILDPWCHWTKSSLVLIATLDLINDMCYPNCQRKCIDITHAYFPWQTRLRFTVSIIFEELTGVRDPSARRIYCEGDNQWCYLSFNELSDVCCSWRRLQELWSYLHPDATLISVLHTVTSMWYHDGEYCCFSDGDIGDDYDLCCWLIIWLIPMSCTLSYWGK